MLTNEELLNCFKDEEDNFMLIPTYAENALNILRDRVFGIHRLEDLPQVRPR